MRNIKDFVGNCTVKTCSAEEVEKYILLAGFIPAHQYHPSVAILPSEIGAYGGERLIFHSFDANEARRKNPWIFGVAPKFHKSVRHEYFRAGEIISDHREELLTVVKADSIWTRIKKALGIAPK